MADFSKITQALAQVEVFVRRDLPHIIGVEAENHFKKSFRDQGFTDAKLEKWKDVKRRDPSSSWYGFQYKANTPRAGRKRKKRSGTTNFSKKATERAVLNSENNQLQQSIKYRVEGRRVVVFSSLPHAPVHNEGGNIKVFGKANAKVPARPFMKKSRVLDQNIINEIDRRVTKIIRNV